jgi:predicted MPP superfamily phosphohydrolase
MGVTMKRKLVLLTLACAALFVLYAFLEPYWLTVTEVTIASADVPPAFDGLRMAFLTDIHHGPYFSLDRVRSVVRRTNALHPDLILLGGDYVHRQTRYIVPCFQVLAGLQAPLGVFGVLGNHDHWQGAVLTSQSMIEAGIEWVNNRSVWVERNGARIKIGGVGDLWEGSQNLQATVGDVLPSDWVILLSHNPDYAEQLNTDLVDLQLSGHTHGGQVTLFGLWAPLLPSTSGQKYRSGVVSTAHTVVVVSRGIGTITPPVRLFCRPEIVIVRLSRGQ